MNNYFNTFKIFDSKNQVLYRKLTFEEVYQMIINEERGTLINESVFKMDLFKNLFNNINKENKIVKCFNTEELKDYFPIKSKIFKILCKNKNKNNYKLYIIKDNFNSIENVQNILKYICNFLPNETDINLIYDDIKNSSGLFTPLNESKELGIIWLYQNISTLNDFAHEFIHYLEWVDGIYGKDIKININENDEYFENQELFLKIFHLDNNDLEYIFDKIEYETLLNDFLQILKKIKEKYFFNLSGYEFAKRICFDLKKVESNKDYLNKIKDINYFKEYFDVHEVCYPLAMIIGYNCLNYKIMNIKNHIFGLFKDENN